MLTRRSILWMLVTVMLICAVVVLVTAGRLIAREKSAAAAYEAAMQERPPIGYVLGEYEGHLALYRENAARPYHILTAQVALLPEADQAAVREGIPAATEEELRVLLEDFDAGVN
ncbi:MAG: hypothetical protein IJ055_04230 [Oscillospiraceae bacterium]|nr:hypothetical protein [Oscillospiraceae bacterium]